MTGDSTTNGAATNGKPKSVRYHVHLSERAAADLAAITARTQLGTSASVAAALRCFRQALDARMAAESGELGTIIDRG